MKKNKIAILQSNYIPWKGYFDIINTVDVFVIYDSVQYTKNDWRNRNLIKTSNGNIWLTIPVQQKKLSQKINETFTASSDWNSKHFKTINLAFKKSCYYKKYIQLFEHIYTQIPSNNLSEINVYFIKNICKILEIKTEIVLSSELTYTVGKTESLKDICKQLNASCYVSGPAAKSYLNENIFFDNGIEVCWMDYSNYPVYNQLFGEFSHNVSILDLLFNIGPNFRSYLKSYQ